jgi:TPR repeat protein
MRKLLPIVLVLFASQVFGESIAELRKKAEAGDAQSQNNLGVKYANGEGVLKDFKEAVKWFRKAAEQENKEAIKLYYKTAEKMGDEALEEAVEWYQKAAEAGNAEAQIQFGEMCGIRGVVVPGTDWENRLKWWRKAAEAGHSEAMFRLGKFNRFENDRGIARDDFKAFKWMKKAAEAGHSEAMFRLGNWYGRYDSHRTAKEIPIDFKEGLKWFLKAAEKGSVDAMFEIGHYHYLGQGGLPKDLKEAYKWYRKAAEQGHSDAMEILLRRKALQGYSIAQTKMAQIYEQEVMILGKKYTRDPQQAYAWYSILALNGSEAASKRRDLIAKQMTPEQIAEAQKLSKELLKQIEANKAKKKE